MLADLQREKGPRALSLLDKVNGGEAIDDFDIFFLEQIFSEARSLMPLFERHPEFKSVGALILSLCEEITHQAFENEFSNNVSLEPDTLFPEHN